MSNETILRATAELSKNVDPALADSLLTEATNVEKEFSLGKWKHSQLDGGRFCEVAARILYASDSNNLNLSKPVVECLSYIENDQAQHHFSDRQSLIHITKVIKAAYKLRSQRGAVHVTPKFTADEIDSRFLLECCRWILADILRIFANADKTAVSELIKQLSTHPVSLVRNYGSRRFLQNTSFTTEEEILAMLYLGPKGGLTIRELINDIPKAASGVRGSAASLCKAQKRALIVVDSKYQITELGIQRIETVIQSKL